MAFGVRILCCRSPDRRHRPSPHRGDSNDPPALASRRAHAGGLVHSHFLRCRACCTSRTIEYPRAFQVAVGAPPGVYEIVARHSDKCLSTRGTSLNDGAAANQWACVGEQNQRGSLEPLDDG